MAERPPGGGTSSFLLLVAVKYLLLAADARDSLPAGICVEAQGHLPESFPFWPPDCILVEVPLC